MFVFLSFDFELSFFESLKGLSGTIVVVDDPVVCLDGAIDDDVREALSEDLKKRNCMVARKRKDGSVAEPLKKKTGLFIAEICAAHRDKGSRCDTPHGAVNGLRSGKEWHLAIKAL